MQLSNTTVRSRWVVGVAASVTVAAALLMVNGGTVAAIAAVDARGTAAVEREDVGISYSADGEVTYASTVTVLHRAAEITTTSTATTSTATPSSDNNALDVQRDTSAAQPTSSARSTAVATTTTMAAAARTVTATVEPNTLLAAGDVLARLDDMPVVLFDGAVAVERDLTSGVVGDDVLALETNLVALGFDPDATITVDETFTSATAAAVARWQESIGLDATGSVALGTVAFVPTPVRVAAPLAAVGARVSDGDALAEVTTLSRGVTFSTTPADAGTLAVGDVVNARRPDRTRLDVAVVSIAPSPSGDGTIIVEATPVGDAELPVLEETPITVTWSRVEATGALVVPTNAIVRRDLTGHAVEVIEADGSTRFVDVTVGVVSGTTVVVSSDALDVGTSVVVP